MDFSLDQAQNTEINIARFTVFTYYLIIMYMEFKPERLPVFTNIAFSFDIYTWGLIGVSIFASAGLLYCLYHKENPV